MSFLSKIFKPSDTPRISRDSNFFMARRAIAAQFRFMNQEAANEGKQAYFKTEIVDAWTAFAQNPCHRTAVQFVQVCPHMAHFLDDSYHRTFNPGIRTAGTFCIDQYKLLDPLPDIKLLKKLPPYEEAFFRPTFKGEVTYRPKPITYMQRKWKVTLSSVHGRIYKWVASIQLNKDKDAESFGEQVIDDCIRWLGMPSEEKLGFLVWDTTDGNVILQLADLDSQVNISIFATSNQTRNLQRLPT